MKKLTKLTRAISDRNSHRVIERLNELDTAGWTFDIQHDGENGKTDVFFILKNKTAAVFMLKDAPNRGKAEEGILRTMHNDPALVARLTTFAETMLQKALDLDADVRAKQAASIAASVPGLPREHTLSDPKNVVANIDSHLSILGTSLEREIDGLIVQMEPTHVSGEDFAYVEMFAQVPSVNAADRRVSVGYASTHFMNGTPSFNSDHMDVDQMYALLEKIETTLRAEVDASHEIGNQKAESKVDEESASARNLADEISENLAENFGI